MPTKRRFPYPYRGLLAVCSDIDATSPWEFIRIHRFLNTLSSAIPYYGRGVGLDIGDSFFSKTYRTTGSAFTTPVTDTKVKTRGRMNSAAREHGPGTRKTLETRSRADWFSRTVPNSSKNTSAAAGSTSCMGVTGTGPSLPSSGEPPTGAGRMDNTIWNGWPRGDSKSTLSRTTRPSGPLSAYRTNRQRKESRGRSATFRVRRPIGLTTPGGQALSFPGLISLTGC